MKLTNAYKFEDQISIHFGLNLYLYAPLSYSSPQRNTTASSISPYVDRVESNVEE